MSKGKYKPTDYKNNKKVSKMFNLSQNLKLIAKWSSVDNIPAVALTMGVTKEQCQSLFNMSLAATEEIAPFSYVESGHPQTTILLYKPE